MRLLVLFLWLVAVLGPLGLSPGIGHNHSEQTAEDSHCIACMALRSGFEPTAPCTVPVVTVLCRPLAAPATVATPTRDTFGPRLTRGPPCVTSSSI
ncbi:MAG: hypothetical protein ABFE16_06785 [Armatimonadia bacterium]